MLIAPSEQSEGMLLGLGSACGGRGEGWLKGEEIGGRQLDFDGLGKKEAEVG